MHYRGLGAILLASVLCLLLSTSAAADIIDLSNGMRLPKRRDYDTKWGEYPTDADLKNSGKKNLKLTYERIEISGQQGDSAQVVRFYITDALKTVEFQAGEQHGARGYWKEAAESFEQAASNLDGAGKQEALYLAMLAAANIPDEELTFRLSDMLLAAAPDTYYFGPAHEMRAKVYARRGALGRALGELKVVTDAPHMNVRDYFSAAYESHWLQYYFGKDKPEQFATAETKFRELLTELERHPRHQLAGVPRLKIMMTLAFCVHYQGRTEEAKKLFQDVLRATTDATDKEVLAGVYYGLGDLAFNEASELSKKLKSAPTVREQVFKLLDQAALHYLRVILLYRDYAPQRELFGSTQGVARVFSRLFQLGGEKDCELAGKAYDYYVQAVRMQRSGEARRLLVAEGKALQKKIEDLCKEEEKEK